MASRSTRPAPPIWGQHAFSGACLRHEEEEHRIGFVLPAIDPFLCKVSKSKGPQRGAVEMIQVDTARFSDHRRRLYTPTWEKLPVLYRYDDISGECPRPCHLQQMIAAAEALGRGLDFIRADFYDTPDRVYLGELTTTPECGYGRFRPDEFDHHLGRRWKLPNLGALPNAATRPPARIRSIQECPDHRSSDYLVAD